MITDLIPDIDQTLYPELDGEHCVHALLADASCTACVSVCPVGAWELTDEALEIDTGACDGCGLCIPACPQQALCLPLRPAIRYRNNEKIAMTACEKVVSLDLPGTVRCINCFGVAYLLESYSEGIRHWMTSTGDCTECERQGERSLADDIDLVSRALEERAHQPIQLVQVTPNAWKESLETQGVNSDASMSRRNFLRGIVTTSAAAQPDDETDAKTKQAVLLEGEGILPWRCTIESEACDLCDACRKLCPTGAIRLEKGRRGQALLVDSARCNGCRLCNDVCEKDAIMTEPWKEATLQAIPVKITVCSACGVRYLSNPESDHQLCQVCESIDHRRNLFQTLS